MVLSTHAQRRAKSRGISMTDISLVIRLGEEIYQEGGIVYFLGEKRARASGVRLKNIAVIISVDGVVVSVIKTRDRKRLAKTNNHFKRRSTPSKRYSRSKVK